MPSAGADNRARSCLQTMFTCAEAEILASIFVRVLHLVGLYFSLGFTAHLFWLEMEELWITLRAL